MDIYIYTNIHVEFHMFEHGEKSHAAQTVGDKLLDVWMPMPLVTRSLPSLDFLGGDGWLRF